MHIYPLRCCLDSLYVVGAVNNGARLRKLPILIRNRIDAIFRHRPLQRSHTCRKHRNPRFGSASNRPTIAMGVITATCGGIAGHICSRCDRHHLERDHSVLGALSAQWLSERLKITRALWTPIRVLGSIETVSVGFKPSLLDHTRILKIGDQRLAWEIGRMSAKTQKIATQRFRNVSLTRGSSRQFLRTDIACRDGTGWLAWSDSNYGIHQDQNPFELPRESCPIWLKALFRDSFSMSCAFALRPRPRVDASMVG